MHSENNPEELEDLPDPHATPDVEPDQEELLVGQIFLERLQHERDDLKRKSQIQNALLEQAKHTLFVTKYVFPAAIIVLAWHYSVPLWLGWLTEQQLTSLREIAYIAIALSSISLAGQKLWSILMP